MDSGLSAPRLGLFHGASHTRPRCLMAYHAGGASGRRRTAYCLAPLRPASWKNSCPAKEAREEPAPRITRGGLFFVSVPVWSAGAIYGSASTMIRKRKVPVIWTPSTNWRLMAVLFASGVPSVIVPADRVEL